MNCLLLQIRCFRTQCGYKADWWTFGEWQVEAEEHGLVFCWDWLSGSRWLPDSFYPRRPSWRKPAKSEKQTLPVAAWTGGWERNTAEYNGHRKITVHRRPKNQAPGPRISCSSVSWLPRSTWTAEPLRHTGSVMWCVREERCFSAQLTIELSVFYHITVEAQWVNVMCTYCWAVFFHATYMEGNGPIISL